MSDPTSFAARSASRICWLLLPSSPMNITVFKSLLKQTCMKIDSAGDGFEAIRLTSEKKYDLIFLDHMMPDMDGIETLQELKTDPGNPNIKTTTICLTANAIAGARREYIAKGFDDYLSKPVDAHKLEEMILYYLPPERIQSVLGNTHEDDGSLYENSLKDLDPIRNSGEIHIETGIGNSGSEEAYLPLLKIFYESIDDKADEIEQFYRNNDIKNYTIKVHALKSSAKLIGAVDLGKEAQELENAGKKEDIAYIREHHEPFMKRYLSFKDTLRDVFNEGEGEEKPEADKELMKEVYSEIKNAAEEMDIDRLESVFEEMKGYRIPEGEKELYRALESAYSDFDYSKMVNLLS